MNITKLKEEAWELYREYLEAKKPTEEQTFLAQEALDVLIRYGFDDFDKNVARYNLACIYIDIRRYDLAEKLLLEIQEHGGLSDPKNCWQIFISSGMPRSGILRKQRRFGKNWKRKIPFWMNNLLVQSAQFLISFLIQVPENRISGSDTSWTAGEDRTVCIPVRQDEHMYFRQISTDDLSAKDQLYQFLSATNKESCLYCYQYRR